MSLQIRTSNHESNWSELPKVQYRNKGFINDNYLSYFEEDTSSKWLRVEDENGQVGKAWRRMQKIYEDVRPTLRSGMHENGELDPALIIPVLTEVLGFTRRKKKFTPPNHDSLIEPDHLLFESQSIALQFWETKGKEARDLNSITCICESKTWDQPLDVRKSEKELSPHEQVLRDMRLTGAPYGILTNGNKWRIYSKDSLSKAAHYFEVSLPVVCESEGPENFELFYNFFSKSATSLVSGVSHISTIQSQSLKFGGKLENNLRIRMFAAVEYLLSGFFNSDRTTELGAHYKNAIQLMYRVLFLLKAEDANLLPIRTAGYAERSLRSICDEATRLVGQWDNGREEDQKDKFGLFDKLVKLSKVIDKGDESWNIKVGFNGGLFSDALNPNIFKIKIANEYLANALLRSTRIVDMEITKSIRVNFDSINYQHIGSVYEGLLEFQPQIATKPFKIIASEHKFDVIEKKKNVPTGFEVLRVVEKGDVFLEAKDEARKNSGSYYTPQWLVLSTLSMCGFLDRISNVSSLDELQSISICDPAMGSGHFLVDAAEFIIRRTQSLYVTGSKLSLDDTIEKVLLKTVFGSDKNELAVLLAKLNIWILLGRKDRKLPDLDVIFKNGNSLQFNSEVPAKDRSKIPEWFDWHKNFSNGKAFGGFDYLVGNPPWGGNIEIEKTHLAALYPGASPDNLNSFDLFIRQGERLISKSGVLAFVVPRNFIRTTDYSDLRKHIGDKITFLADAGAAFDGVTQEAVVFGMAKEKQKTFKSYPYLKCFETNDKSRTFETQEINTVSVCAPDYCFNFYWTKDLSALNEKQFSPDYIRLDEKVDQNRGIEYGGNGEVGKCPHCAKYISRPKKKKKDYKDCDFCGERVTLDNLPPYFMISDTKTAKHTVPVYSGRDIQKFYSKNPKFLQLKLAGIKYKPNLFDGKPTIFITKITDAIRCDIGLDGEFVTQGVYTLKSKDDSIPLEWIAAVLNSEAAKFFYEFRYNVGATLTTNLLLEHLLAFRIPTIPKNIKAISTLVKALKKTKPGSTKWNQTLEILDNAVFDAYGFKKKDIDSVRSFLSEVATLKAVTATQMKSEGADYNLSELSFEKNEDQVAS